MRFLTTTWLNLISHACNAWLINGRRIPTTQWLNVFHDFVFTTFNPWPGLLPPSFSFPWVVPMVNHIEAFQASFRFPM